MKHTSKVTFYLMFLFFISQVIGLVLLSQSIQTIDVTEQGDLKVEYEQPLTGRPELEGSDSFLYTVGMILFGTVILLFIIKKRMFKIWRAWFFLAVFGALSVSLSVVIPDLVALVIAGVLAYVKIFRPNVIIHNATEVFMYAGIAILISPMFNIFWVSMMLIAISIYDAFAVWQSKHMVVLAKAQAESKMFAGLLIPYSKTKKTTTISTKVPKGMKTKTVKSAILGGGDIAFPLIFAGSVMTWLIELGETRLASLLYSLIIAVFSGIALYLLLTRGKKDTFYPAMPFISSGCFVGIGIVYVLITMLG